MSTSANEIYLAGERLDLDEETQLLPTFQANDRTKPESIQSDYSAEFSVPGSARNHRLLSHAANSQPVKGQAYKRMPAVLTSGGVETLPLALLYIKGFSENRYQLQIFGGNKRLVEALGEKKLSDLDLNRFNHYWTPGEIMPKLPFEYWKANGWGYEVYERGKPLDLQAINPYDLYPSCSANLVFRQILTDAGFGADSLLGEPLWAALNVPSANAFTYSQDYRDARQLTAGFTYDPAGPNGDYINTGLYHDSEFPPEQIPFDYTARKPYHAPTKGATYTNGTYVADTQGYYDLVGDVPLFFACRADRFGEVSCKVMLYINGALAHDADGNEIGFVEKRGAHFKETFSPTLKRYLLKPLDKVELYWQGDEWGTGPFDTDPTDPNWYIGRHGGQSKLPNGLTLATDVRLSVTLLPEFPEGGLVKLQDWLPDMKQLDFVKTAMLTMGLTIQADDYTPYLFLAPGNRLLANISKAKDWTGKRDAASRLGRQPERKLAFRFGSYGQTNKLVWEEDENVTQYYGDGTILVEDEVLPLTNDLAKLPFAATEASPVNPGLLRILNFESQDLNADPPTYSSLTAKPRLVLRADSPVLDVQLITTPANPGKNIEQVLTPAKTSPSYFAGVELSLLLDNTVLTTYWADLRAMLDQARYLTENYRLTPQDIAELDFSIPIYDALLGDFFAVSNVSEYDARRPVEVTLCRLNAAHLGAPLVPSENGEFYAPEFYPKEFYADGN
ncbi:MAG: hypothetical protein ACRYFV_01635 [Janthinobacterium lividum]